MRRLFKHLGFEIILFNYLLIMMVIVSGQIAIPESCKDLAIREGYPLVMSEQELAYAKNKLATASQKDSLVAKCKKAVDAIKYMKKQGM